MTMHPISGCDQGIPRPVDTPQHGVRSVPDSRAEVLARFNVAMDAVIALWGSIDDGPSDLIGLAVELQKAADLARKLAGWR